MIHRLTAESKLFQRGQAPLFANMIAWAAVYVSIFARRKIASRWWKWRQNNPPSPGMNSLRSNLKSRKIGIRWSAIAKRWASASTKIAEGVSDGPADPKWGDRYRRLPCKRRCLRRKRNGHADR